MSNSESGETKIQIRVGDAMVPATLFNNPIARDLISQLPLTLDCRDYGNQEKLAELPRPLTREGAPAGASPGPGYITYYVPGHVIVFCYKQIGYFPGIVPIGKFDGSMDAIRDQATDFTAHVELAE